MTHKWRNAVAASAALCMIGLAACGASGDAQGSDGGESSPTTEATTDAATSDGSFGTLETLCGDGEYTVDPTEQGLDNGKLNLGVATDRNAEIRPGLNKEVWDASVAFAGWCNEQGGIGGLEVNIVELDGALFNVEVAMTKACAEVFAMVGGGFVQDQLEFSGKEGSDFHQCGMIDIPSFSVSIEKTGSNGMVQPLPSSNTFEVNTPFRDTAELYPEDATSAVIVYGDLPSIVAARDKREAALNDIGIDVAATISYPVTGVTDWTPYARQIIESDAPMMLWIGEPANGAALLAKLTEQGWTGRMVADTNMYNDLLFSVGEQGPEGSIIRMATHTTEEADEWPAVQQYIDILETYVPDYTTGPLGVTSVSASLLFTVAANACADANDGVLDRTCILEQAAAQDEWTGGGLHALTDPASTAEVEPTPCNLLLEVKDGEFVRLYPEIGGDGDDGDGFHCPDDGTTVVPNPPAGGKIDPSRPI